MCKERSDELGWGVYLKIAAYFADTSVCNVAAANFSIVSNITNTCSFATHFARRSCNKPLEVAYCDPVAARWPGLNDVYCLSSVLK